ncbi:monooxygenase, partial [Streptomyces sp. P17]|nr:monooxygenase [Streptomyces sp. P17]
MDNFNALVSGIPQSEDLVNDGWTDIIGNMLALMRKGGSENMDLATTMQLADFKKMESIRASAVVGSFTTEAARARI